MKRAIIEFLVDWIFKAMRGVLVVFLVGCQSGQLIRDAKLSESWPQDEAPKQVSLPEPAPRTEEEIKKEQAEIEEFLRTAPPPPASFYHSKGFVKTEDHSTNYHAATGLTYDYFSSDKASTLILCNRDNECSSSELCSTFSDKLKVGACAIGCRSNVQCADGYRCDGYMPNARYSFEYPERLGLCIKNH